MRKKFSYSYIIIIVLLFITMSLPKRSVDEARGISVAFLAPTWNYLLVLKDFFNIPANNNTNSGPQYLEKIQRLQIENIRLRTEMAHLRESIQQELRIITKLAVQTNNKDLKQSAQSIQIRHQYEIQNLLQLQLQSVPAKVIFRPASSWNNALWINAGSDANLTLKSEVIAKNSPVILGDSIIGIIDYVGKTQSKVRLITDPGLNPSVRVFRENYQQSLAYEKLYSLLHFLEKNDGILSDAVEQNDLMQKLKNGIEKLSPDHQFWYLAKGELHGSSKSTPGRSQHQLLKGIGFNYDFDDEAGPARDLFTDQSEDPSIVPILRKGDILVTTGMDGVFPPNLLVAEVIHVYPLKEGDYYYELEAQSTAGNFDDLTTVFILPPQTLNR